MSSNTSTVYVSEDLIKVILLFCAKVVFKLNKIDISIRLNCIHEH